MIKLIDLRKKKKMTQIELAKDLKVTQASISRWEKDQLSIEGKI